MFRQQRLLDQPRHAQFLLQALALLDFCLLLLHQLRHAHGRRRLRGQRVEQRAVVAGVVLLAQPRAQVQQADQVALAQQRHDQLHAARSQFA